MSDIIETTSYSPEDKKLGDVQDVIKDTTTGVQKVKDAVEQNEEPLDIRIRKMAEWFNDKKYLHGNIAEVDFNGTKVFLKKSHFRGEGRHWDHFSFKYKNHHGVLVEYKLKFNKLANTYQIAFSENDSLINTNKNPTQSDIERFVGDFEELVNKHDEPKKKAKEIEKILKPYFDGVKKTLSKSIDERNKNE